jgi:hypothetical protein
MEYIYVDELKRRKELGNFSREQLITLILDLEENQEDRRYNSMGDDL